MYTTYCSGCGINLHVNDENARKRVICPKCQTSMDPPRVDGQTGAFTYCRSCRMKIRVAEENLTKRVQCPDCHTLADPPLIVTQRQLPEVPQSIPTKAPRSKWPGFIAFLVVLAIVAVILAAITAGMGGSNSGQTSNPSQTMSPSAYADAVSSELKELAVATQDISQLSARTTPSSAVVILTEAQGHITHVSDEAHVLRPPACYASVHTQYLEMIGILSQGVTDGLAGAQNVDATRLSTGASELQDATDRMNTIVPEVQSVRC